MIPVKDILKTLRTIINESATEEDSFTIETDEALKEFIRLALLALMNDEGVMAEASEMTDSSSISFEKRPDGLFFAYIKIPADYIRLVSVNLTGWRYPVTMLYPDNSPLYSAQYSSAPGVGNGPSIPVAFITNDTMRSIIAHAVKEQGDTVSGIFQLLQSQKTEKSTFITNMQEHWHIMQPVSIIFQ